jgi:hypothetical protein
MSDITTNLSLLFEVLPTSHVFGHRKSLSLTAKVTATLSDPAFVAAKSAIDVAKQVALLHAAKAGAKYDGFEISGITILENGTDPRNEEEMIGVSNEQGAHLDDSLQVIYYHI